MLDKINFEKLLVLDIETVPQQPDFHDLDEKLKELWVKKAETFIKNNESPTPAEAYNRAGIYAEFGKIVCISFGIFVQDSGTECGYTFRIKSIANQNEKELLQEFAHLLSSKFNRGNDLLCGHNAKEFDFPYMCRRMLVNGIKIPFILNNQGKKPWEVPHIDTMELWKFGDYKNYTSLELLATIFNIPTPKDDIDGSMVGDIFWKLNELDRIKTYCQKDVVTVAQLLLRYRGLPLLSDENITFA